MSSGSEKKYSMEELMEKNKPIVLPKVENHPTEREWAQMMALQVQSSKLLASLLQKVEHLPRQYPVEQGLIDLAEELRSLGQTVEKLELAGRKKERHISLPKVSLPRPSLAWLWVIPIITGLLTIWYASDALWNNLLIPLSRLFR